MQICPMKESCFGICEFDGGVMTVADLKEMIKDWPELDRDGEPSEVWMETGWCRSSPVTTAGSLNFREDEDGEHADFIIGCGHKHKDLS